MRTIDPRRRELAELWGVQLSYHDVWGKLREADPAALDAVLVALGALADADEDDAAAIARRERTLAERPFPRCHVLWSGRPASLPLRVPPEASGPARLHARLEDGSARDFEMDLGDLPLTGHRRVGSIELVERHWMLPPLPEGYHELTLAWNAQSWDCRLIVAPLRAPASEARHLGLFVPLYALRSGRGLGHGDLHDLAALRAWALERGAGLIGTTPLLPCFLEEPFIPSPYAPVSRLFWGEHFADPLATPEFETSASARALAAAPEFLEGLARCREAPLIDYRESMALRRRLLDALAADLWPETSPRRAAIDAYRREHPEAESYARFRAAVEREGCGWRSWPQPLRQGTLADAGLDERRVFAHLYAQWITAEQVATLHRTNNGAGDLGLYLDFPVGVHRESYDVWSRRHLFCDGAALGAPPDPLFSGGQDWDFPPLHPDRSREQGHDYFIECVRHHLEHAGVLRIDHVMALHRLFWIPSGRAATDGLYVRYPHEELYGILCLEATRAGALLLGEDLGTVPDEVRAAMREHGFLRMHVGQFWMRPESGRAFEPAPEDACTSLNTHDTPTFAGFWEDADTEAFEEIGCLDADEAQAERTRRAGLRARVLEEFGLATEASSDVDLAAIMRRAYEELADSDARVLLVTLEDLWLEEAPQNIPGTGFERPNWRRPSRRPLEEILADDKLSSLLRRLAAARRSR